MTISIRSAITFAVLLAVAAPAAAQRGARNTSDGPEITERFSRTVRLGGGGSFDLTNISGDVVVTGGGGDEVRIDAVKRTRDRDEAAGRARLQEVQIQVREVANRVEVRTEHPRNRRGDGVSVDYTIALPQNANVTLRSVSGDIRATNVRGELNTETVSGSLFTAGARRLGTLKTVSGDVEITDAESDAAVTATTVSGDVIVRSLKARAVELNTVSGGVRLEGVESERAGLRTVSGDIQYTGPLARNGRYDMNTHSGNIRLAVSTSGFDLEASTFSGDLRSDYALTLGGAPVQLDRRGGRRGPPNRAIRGAFGDGGAQLSLRSFSGDLVITRR